MLDSSRCSESEKAYFQKVLYQKATEDIYKQLFLLLQGKSVLTYIDTSVIYPQIRNDAYSLYSFLLVVGYLKVVAIQRSANGDYLCEVALPNKEISFVYKKENLANFASVLPKSSALSIGHAICHKDTELLKECLRNFLKQSMSYLDTNGEAFYHGLLLGLCAI